MNSPILRNPILRYASLAGAGLPAGERHLATTATRRRVHRIVPPTEDAAPALAELTFTVTIGDGAPTVAFEGDAGTAPRDAKPGDAKSGDAKSGDARPGVKPRRLTLLSY